jgi:predicted PurR-regulated permease PerM
MIDPLIQFFEKLITQFSWRRLIFILVVLFISIGVLAWYETYTGHFRLNKIEHTTKLLSQLTELSEKIKKENNSKLTNIFEGVTKDLDMYVNHPVTAFSIHPAILKAMAAATL